MYLSDDPCTCAVSQLAVRKREHGSLGFLGEAGGTVKKDHRKGIDTLVTAPKTVTVCLCSTFASFFAHCLLRTEGIVYK